MQAPSIAAELHGFLKMGEPGLVSGFPLVRNDFVAAQSGSALGKPE
jgi:hypothetical protein